MAKGWSDDDAVSTQISGSIADEVARVRSRLPRGESLSACEECDAPIPETRQRAVPGVRLCVDCQRDYDKAEGGPASLYNRRGSKDSQLR
ncbi:DksA/TraR family C4-type zinc finger protein [Desulfosarcina sp. OttesenSCG-928-G10]|nr:DksA/TraR family C4-type zinc finger protein [Desulfosarcina sp. OttesenSCG-928-G10]MDL2320826.1 DksA/TraR family C4-type zinc finger protein [Desulfosarcina sp. OttesenSCG-928-B08]